MKEIVIASPVAEQLAEFSQALAQSSGLTITHCNSVADTLAVIAKQSVLLLIVDARISVDEGKQLIRDTLMVNAMINSAVLSDSPEEDFHENMEGLGLLMQLPQMPNRADAQKLWQKLLKVNPNVPSLQPS